MILDRFSFGFHNPNHAAALACALLPPCWGWRRYPWLGRLLSLALFLALLMTRSRTGLAVAVASGARCAMWGEDDTRRVAPRERIDPEFLNPLYNVRIATLWRKDAP